MAVLIAAAALLLGVLGTWYVRAGLRSQERHHGEHPSGSGGDYGADGTGGHGDGGGHL